MNIGHVSKNSSVPAKTIRYYESIELIPPANRLVNGYRDYSEEDVQRLQFIHRSRKLGFSIKDVSNLLKLWSNKKRASVEVKKLALDHIDQLDLRINELQAIRGTLVHLKEKCYDDERPDCPILESLNADH